MNTDKITFEYFCENCVSPPIHLNEAQKELVRFLDWCKKNKKYPILYGSRQSYSKTYFGELYKKYNEEINGINR